MNTYQRIARLVLVAGLATTVSRAEETAVVKEQTVNVRGQPSLMGEVITQLKKGEKVVILEEIPVSKPKKDEPSKWIKIEMPANTPVWVSALFIDSETKKVKPNRLNLRGGPGENYSVVGRLQAGDVVKEIRTVGDWMEIETPPGAYAFLAEYLVSREPAAAPAPAPSSPAPVAQTEKAPAPPAPVPGPPVGKPLTKPVPPPAVVERNIPVENAPAAIVDRTPPPLADNAVKPAGTPTLPASPPPSAVTVPVVPAPAATETIKPETPGSTTPPKRVVRREGVVRGTVSIQAPTYYELVGGDTGRVINYLHLNDTILDKLQTSIKDFKDYKGRAVVVTGEEAVDPRWPNTPVIEVETLKLVL